MVEFQFTQPSYSVPSPNPYSTNSTYPIPYAYSTHPSPNPYTNCSNPYGSSFNHNLLQQQPPSPNPNPSYSTSFYPDLTHTHTLQQQNYVSSSPLYLQQPTIPHSIHKPFTQPPPLYSSNIYQQPNTYQEPLNIITASSPQPICNPNFYQDPSFKYHQSVISSNPYTPYATVSHPSIYGYSAHHHHYPDQPHNPHSQSIVSVFKKFCK